jgi:hypothetical protein
MGRHASAMTHKLLVGSAVAVAICLTWLAWDELLYLQHGYSVRVSLAEGPASTTKINFPAWRIAVHILLWIAAMAAILAYIQVRSWAQTVAWLTFVGTLAMGVYDVVLYGTIASPTSIWSVLLLLLFALLTTFGRLFPTVDA